MRVLKFLAGTFPVVADAVLTTRRRPAPIHRVMPPALRLMMVGEDVAAVQAQMIADDLFHRTTRRLGVGPQLGGGGGAGGWVIAHHTIAPTVVTPHQISEASM
jgi:hypothetical protein